MRVAVVGGGIAGLAAAWELRDRAEVTVFEPGALGGKLRTTEFAGRGVDEGPDAFITRTPEATALCAELGLAGELVAPAAGRTLLWYRGRLLPLPDGLVLGVPKRVGPLARSGLLSPLGLARAGLDLVLPASPIGEDLSVGELVSRRFGAQVADRLVEPLVGGIHAARICELSAAAASPQLLAAARRSRSLLLGLRSAPAPPTTAGPLFLTPRGGLGRLVEVLAGRLAGAGVHFVTARVDAVGSAGDRIAVGDAAYDAAVIAVPAPEAARLLGDAAPAGLAQIELTSVALVTLAYATTDLDVPAGVNGFLVPRCEDRLVTACSFGSSKWPQWAAPDRSVLRVSVGRHGDDRGSRLGDAELGERVTAEIGAALHVRAAPAALRVSRWPASMPFYRVGHPSRVAAVAAELRAALPGVALAGASYGGAGIPACIASGRAAAGAALAGFGQRGAAAHLG
jgi:oxygen-dependent protoporphyrinogen oxidase